MWEVLVTYPANQNRHWTAVAQCGTKLVDEVDDEPGVFATEEAKRIAGIWESKYASTWVRQV